MKNLFLFISLVIAPCWALAQTAETVPGELLVLLKAEHSPEQVLQSLALLEGVETQLRANRKLAPAMNIWQLTFDHQAVSAELLIAALKKHSDVAIAQVNHKITSRLTTPNDPQFGTQWQYVNFGGIGAVPDADIDADEAWDITTGGKTPLGDDIVIAVIDDGIDLNHPDFAGNLWVNSQEVANNNIDDDNNGYVDDYKGWNAYDNTDDVGHSSFEDHGTPVAGIVGARGNNAIGVAGVNWEVQIMVVKGGGNEAEAVAAYAYVLAQRKLWNSSNGQSGAFVVASNASWGTDFGQASNAPLWCAMYDSLGKAGVLNVGATANDNINVDQVGDLPSTCPSKYLLSVTNLKKDDEKETFAGYGPVHIDLGAPGEDTYTLAKGSTYDFFGGTSGASPHVAGAIGLIYSAPCTKLAQVAKDDPGTAAETVRNFILNGGDPNTSLQGITATGNRLNLFGALTELTNNCLTISTEEHPLHQQIQWNHYPNPATESVQLQLENGQIQLNRLQVVDVIGRVFFLPLRGDGSVYIANLSTLAKGWYSIQPLDQNGLAVGSAKKMVVQ